LHGLVSLYSGFHIFSSIKYKNIYQQEDDFESRVKPGLMLITGGFWLSTLGGELDLELFLETFFKE